MMDRDKYNIILYLYILQTIIGHMQYSRLIVISLYNYLYKNPYNCSNRFALPVITQNLSLYIPYLDYLTRIERYPKVEDMAS